MDLFTILLAFYEGIGLIASPCILPILPIFLASSLTGTEQRPQGIFCGFILIFVGLVFFSRWIISNYIPDLSIIRIVSFGLLLAFGMILFFDSLSEKFSLLTQEIANKSNTKIRKLTTNQHFFSGFIIGGLLALVWTPCAGPILAAVIVQTILQKTNLYSFFALLSFSIGAAIPLYLIAHYGRQFTEKLTFVTKNASLFRKVLGLTMILNVSYMLYQENIIPTSATNGSIKTSMILQKALWKPYPFPKIEGITQWINSPALTSSQLKGNVVLIDFWTYSCINCLRTIPYLNKWYQTYHAQGLEIIGVHSPEFYFEKNYANVQRAVQQLKIKYPIALDNQFTTWMNFKNHYWPAHFLIDKKGNVVYEHFGEGAYDVTENNIRYLLGLKEVPQVIDHDTNTTDITPETYLGYERANSNLSPLLYPNQIHNYEFKTQLTRNEWQLKGKWMVESDKIVVKQKNSELQIKFRAKHVYIVMGNSKKTTDNVQVFYNNQPLSQLSGTDIVNSHLEVFDHKLYDLLNSKKMIEGTLTLKFKEENIEIYTLTFGN